MITARQWDRTFVVWYGLLTVSFVLLIAVLANKAWHHLLSGYDFGIGSAGIGLTYM